MDQEIQYIYNRLSELRETYGKPIQVVLASYTLPDGSLDISSPDFSIGDHLFPGFLVQQHHPYLHYLKRKYNWSTETIKLLPGETYEILTKGTHQVIRIKPGFLMEYEPISDVTKLISDYINILAMDGWMASR
jgi:hypothetical protein